MLIGMANSVDPDQTALQEQSDLGQHCLHMPFCKTLRCSKFMIFTILLKFELPFDYLVIYLKVLNE